ncbi:MAG: prephenate dehydrogenase [Oscillospiraceae bacterium]|nr:prephenate dehydrogenase [Oscillospiraceae bacterium]
MKWISDSSILIVGLGLMGGSYARALKRLGYRVCAISRSRSTIDYALAEGLIDAGSTEPDGALIGEADAVIFALYPGVLLDWLRDNQHLLKSGALLTDVTGVKGGIVSEIQAMLRPDLEFIASHPMAGREVYGVRNSDDRIFHGANFLITPTERNSPEAVAWCAGLGRLLGCRKVSILSPEEHDEMIGFVSQLTHCIAVALMTCNDNPELVNYTGDSFRDLTRIARINDEMWSELFLRNKTVLLREMDAFAGEFRALRAMIADDDREALREKMRLSTARRALFDREKDGG